MWENIKDILSRLTFFFGNHAGKATGIAKIHRPDIVLKLLKWSFCLMMLQVFTSAE